MFVMRTLLYHTGMGRVIAIHQGKAGPPPRDDRFVPVVEWVLASGELGRPYLVPLAFTPDRDAADQVRRSLYLAARYYCSCGLRTCTRKYGNVPGQNQDNPAGGCPAGGRRVSCQAAVVRVNGHVRVQFAFHDKREAMRQVVAKYGPDPDKWPYLSKRKRKRTEEG